MSTSDQKSGEDPIAVVGMACRFPGEATDVNGFWNLLHRAGNPWSEVPRDRFDAASFWHPDGSKSGALGTRHGHFLSDDISRFDAPFFNITPVEAKAMDPQIRLLLEVAYESFENAGWTLESLKGSDTSVYTALYNHDYGNMLYRDPESLPAYTLTGNGCAMPSNRISYYFDLRGPSFSLDTGCSGGLVALHSACTSIWMGTSRQSIVGGSNLILDPASMISPSHLQFYSSEGRGYAFDHRASGYGRGEGTACVVLKRLSDALADGDTVRAVIRSCAINQDGRTEGITSPSQHAQEALIRSTYAMAGLDLAKTVYIEAHGSGTALGDSIESSALGSVFRSNSTAQRPLLVGSVKTNLGHMENVSGLAGLLKAILIIEKGCIPPSLNFEKPAPGSAIENSILQVVTKHQQLHELGSNQISVNSFGYGGTNAHVVLDKLDKSEVSDEGLDVREDAQTNLPEHYIFVLSACSQDSAQMLATRLREYLATKANSICKGLSASLAYTLCHRRSLFPWRAAVIADSLPVLQKVLDSLSFKHAPKYPPKIAFVFTGQGSQWYAMGRELLQRNAVFCRSIDLAEKILLSLGADWKLTEELQKGPDSCRLDDAAIAQPSCTALQLSLVDMLASWNITPSGVIGHSSGEIAAAYACKAISFEDALHIAYARGRVTVAIASDKSLAGAMLSAGLSYQDAVDHISKVSASYGSAQVACINSPKSVTISGDELVISQLHKALTEQDVFTRILPVSIAYHSHHMSRVKSAYKTALSDLPQPSCPNVPFFSSVEGRRLEETSLDVDYWVRNLTMPVLFSDAFSELCTAVSESRNGDRVEQTRGVLNMVVELGPHSGLKGPIMQILEAANLHETEVRYTSALVRHESASKTALAMAEALFDAGVAIDLTAVNFGKRRPRAAQNLEDLPSYPWDHSISYWHESRLSRNYRHRQDPPHNLLGVLTLDSSIFDLRWRRFIHLSEMPWLSGHCISDRIVVPGAAFLVMAMEASLWYTAQTTAGGAFPQGVTLSDVSFVNPLIIPSSGDPVEMMLTFRPASMHLGKDLGFRHEFIITSSSDGYEVSENCRGFVKVLASAPKPSIRFSKRLDADEARAMCPQGTYEQLKELGIRYSGPFRGITKIWTDSRFSRVTINERHSNGASKSNDTSGSLPAMLDTCIQSIFPVLMTNGALNSPMMPTSIKEARLSCTARGITNQPYEVLCQMEKMSGQRCIASIDAVAGNQTVISITSLEASVTGGNIPSRDDQPREAICQKLIMTVDPELLGPHETKMVCQAALNPHAAPSDFLLFSKVCRYFASLTLLEVDNIDTEMMRPHLKSYLQWLKTLVPDENIGIQHIQQDKTEGDLLVQKLENQSCEGRLVCAIGRNLTSILRGNEDPLSLMMKDDLLQLAYQDDPSMEGCAIMAAEHARLLGMKNPGLRVLEIWAGTGSATIHLLNGLSNPDRTLFQQYTFTDVSAGFFPKAKERFSKWEQLMEYRTLNIEEAPDAQGFLSHCYDLIIAANVLHATTYIEQTLGNVHQLLRPGGKLYLLENTTPAIRRSFVHGTLPGWWLGAAKRKKNNPSLSTEEWETALKQATFSGIDCSVEPFDETEEQTDSFMISTALPHPSSIPENSLCIVLFAKQGESVPTDPEYRLAKILSQSPPFREDSIFSLGDPGIRNRVCLCIADLDGARLANLDEKNFDALKSTFQLAKEIIWVTQGASGDCPHPQAALSQGLIRVLRRENSDVRIATIDLDVGKMRCDQALANSLQHFLSQYSLLCEDGNLDWIERDGRWLVPRLVPDNAATQAIHIQLGAQTQMLPQIEPILQPGRSFRLTADRSKTLQSLQFVDDLSLDKPIGDDEVEIEVVATGANFRDIMILLGEMDNEMFGECSGVVAHVGCNARGKFSPGDRVYSWQDAAHATRVRAPASVTKHIPKNMSFAEAASLPVVCHTVYYSLVSVAKLQKGETVLIHAGAGGIGQAAIQLALHIGAVIFTTVGSEQKKKLIVEGYGIPPSHIFSTRDTAFGDNIREVTGGVGVDVVLNSLAGPFLVESLGILAPFGRFIELGKVDVVSGSRMDMALLEHSVSFHYVDLAQIFYGKPKVAANLSLQVQGLVEAGIFRPPVPLHLHPVSQVEEAFRQFQNRVAGKIVFSYGVADKVKVIPRNLQPKYFSPDGTYLVVGGQGGLGREICSWMARLGAKNIVILSPSGSANPSTQKLIEQLGQKGTEVHAISCDIGSKEQLDGALEICRQRLPPIRGVIQAALRLRDSTFQRMTHDDYRQVLNPKVRGTYALHDALENSPLDFFVILSSIAGLIGNPGQGNYAAASTFQDAFARWRTSQGKPTRSIDIGPIEGAGYAHENPGAFANLRKSNMDPVPLDYLLSMLTYAISNPIEDVAASQLSLSRFSSITPGESSFPLGNPLFGHLCLAEKPLLAATSMKSLVTPESIMSDALTVDRSIQEVAAKIQLAISHKVSQITGVPLHQIDLHQSLSLHGGDSLIVAEFKNWLQRELRKSFLAGRNVGQISLQELAELAAASHCGLSVSNL